MMNKTYGDLMGEYENAREVVKRFGTWSNLDTLVEELINNVAPKNKQQNVIQNEFSFATVNHD